MTLACGRMRRAVKMRVMWWIEAFFQTNTESFYFLFLNLMQKWNKRDGKTEKNDRMTPKNLKWKVKRENRTVMRFKNATDSRFSKSGSVGEWPMTIFWWLERSHIAWLGEIFYCVSFLQPLYTAEGLVSTSFRSFFFSLFLSAPTHFSSFLASLMHVRDHTSVFCWRMA